MSTTLLKYGDKFIRFTLLPYGIALQFQILPDAVTATDKIQNGFPQFSVTS